VERETGKREDREGGRLGKEEKWGRLGAAWQLALLVAASCP